jgi:hypothetical protein
VGVDDVGSLARNDLAQREHHLRIRCRQGVRPFPVAVEAGDALRRALHPVDADSFRVRDGVRVRVRERRNRHVVTALDERARNVFHDALDATDDRRVELAQQEDPH